MDNHKKARKKVVGVHGSSVLTVSLPFLLELEKYEALLSNKTTRSGKPHFLADKDSNIIFSWLYCKTIIVQLVSLQDNETNHCYYDKTEIAIVSAYAKDLCVIEQV